MDLGTCELIADLAGYKAEPLRVTRTGDIGPVNVGTIVLRAATPGQPFTVSLTSLAAPDKAKAAFEKGEEQRKKGKWAAAMDSFRKAIAAYPRYALAWLELGRVQATQKDFVNARQSFRESITQDSKLADGYVELAHLAAQQQQWQELAGATDHLVQIHPDAAEYWFLNSAANFNLGNLRQAEASITRGIRLDSAHRLPQMEYLYGMILARKQDYKSAVEQITLYLKLSPQASDANDARQALAELQKRSQVATQ
jgi:tetratricopeptide (TPR) repeat protein